MKRPGNEARWAAYLEAAQSFWETQLGPTTTQGVILTEGFSHHLRAHVRNLAVANALRRIEPARLVVVTGTDRRWMETVWEDLDTRTVAEVVSAHGGEVFDIHATVDRLIRAPGGRLHVRVADRQVDLDMGSRVDEREVASVARATWSRLQMRPPYEHPPDDDADHAQFVRRTRALAITWDALVRALEPKAFVTTHVDYDQWALGVVSALRSETPVVHVQSTGGLKAYAVFPEHLRRHRATVPSSDWHGGGAISSDARYGPTFRSILTSEIADVFEQFADNEHYRQRSNDVVIRSRRHLGRPSWWRSGANAVLELEDATQRAHVRHFAARQLGIDADRPIVAVFNHAISDALNTNVEAFQSLSEWFEQTIEYASQRDDVSWLLLDHPSQDLYDASGFFDGLTHRYASHEHLGFRRSNTLTKNSLWSLTDLAVTVRGSISNEMPSYGIGAVQAGWSEWSGCGVSYVASTPDSYWSQLDECITAVKRFSASATYQQMVRARLWQWFYRSASDVSTAFVPHWDQLEGKSFLTQITKNYLHVEPDEDPLFVTTEHLWRQHSAVLLRAGLGTDSRSGLNRLSQLLGR